MNWIALVDTPLFWPLRLTHCGSPQSTALSLVSFLQVCKLNFYETSHSSSWSGPLISYQNSDRYKVFYLLSILTGRPWGMSHLVNKESCSSCHLCLHFRPVALGFSKLTPIPYSNGLVYTKGQASTPSSPAPPHTLRNPCGSYVVVQLLTYVWLSVTSGLTVFHYLPALFPLAHPTSSDQEGLVGCAHFLLCV